MKVPFSGSDELFVRGRDRATLGWVTICVRMQESPCVLGSMQYFRVLASRSSRE